MKNIKLTSNGMKNKILKTIVITGGMLVAIPALASTVVLAPANVNATPGQTFTITVSVDPSGVQNYAEKVELAYPADLLEVKSFSLANNWIALTQSGYDVIDNANGLLVKSAGLPSGLSTLTMFGAVTFSAKKSGNGTIKIGGNSVAFEASTQRALTGGDVPVVIASGVAPTVEPATAKIEKVVKSQAVAKPVVQATSSNQTAAVATSGFNLNWLWLLLLPIIGIVYYFVRDSKKV